MMKPYPKTLGELKRTGYQARHVKDELRANLTRKLKAREPLFPAIVGYEETVVPQIVNAILSRHDFILLGLRGQAKTRLLRSLTRLLDPVIPVIQGSELNEDPLRPQSAAARRLVESAGDDTPIGWLAAEDRYHEKLATPDVTIADLIGDIDPIKAAKEKRALSDPEVIHYGIVPRTNRGIFAVNELPDLPTRIQVGLLDILEERDIQIRGFPIRLPLDLLVVFTANPEDYTNRGSIITPLRDRIASQIQTHYPLSIDHGMAITSQEAWCGRGAEPAVRVPAHFRHIVEQVAVQARTSSFVDQKSGVSARMTIALLENLISSAERRAFLNGLGDTCVRVSDLDSAIPAITGKIELVYEGEQQGPTQVARHLIGKAVKMVFDEVMPDPYKDLKAGVTNAEYDQVLRFFKSGGQARTSDTACDLDLHQDLGKIPGLLELARKHFHPQSPAEEASVMELILEGLHQSALLAKRPELSGASYVDQFDDMVKDLSR
ncbi:MAG: magnesium chelatase [Planctomycetota bacterium]